MKKYLFGLGTMLVGAGLMFVLMHGEVSADGEYATNTCELFNIKVMKSPRGPQVILTYCTMKGLTCVISGPAHMIPNNGISCVKD